MKTNHKADSAKGRMPVGFVGHGAPTLGLEDNAITQAWHRWAQGLPRPKAVLVVSAHWLSPEPEIGPMVPRPLLYDFYGFPDELYRVKYAPPAAEKEGQRAMDLLREAGLNPKPAPKRGLDHGAWVPLMKMFPSANIPAFQVSLPTQVPLENHLALGKALAPLREEGVFILGSGNVTHNLGRVNFANREAQPDAWARDFDAWVAGTLEAFDLEKLTRYLKAPGGGLSHPTDDHYVPLVAAAAAAETQGKPSIRFPYVGFDYGTLSMRCVQNQLPGFSSTIVLFLEGFAFEQDANAGILVSGGRLWRAPADRRELALCRCPAALAKGPGQAAVALDVLSPWLPVLPPPTTISPECGHLAARRVFRADAGQYAALQPIVKTTPPVGAAPGYGPRPIVRQLPSGLGTEEDAVLLELTRNLFSTAMRAGP